MTLEEMKELKKELGFSYEYIAKMANLPVGTVQKVLGGITKTPRYETLKALESVFELKQSNVIRESQPVYQVEKKQGEYTAEDYFALPDERRVELIDGVIYDMASPTAIHQFLADELRGWFMTYVRKKGGKCLPFTSPLDVQLDCDDKTIVQPDVVIICDRNKYKAGRIFGAPDLVVEVISPSTMKKDIYLKSLKYENAGVREYWIVDPKKKRIFVHQFEKTDSMIDVYTFDDEVPVGIWNNECKVVFREIYEYIEFLEEQV